MFHWILSVALAGVAAPGPQQTPPTPTSPPAQAQAQAADQSTDGEPTRAHEEEIVVTAALESEERARLPVSATVVTREQIRDRQATAVYDVLRTVPGLDVAQSGTPGKVVSVFSRGAESNQSLVLWNGMPLNDPYFGGFDWAFLPTDGVGRIEVVRGPFSALYGSDAMGAVVQVLSDRSQGGVARLEGGSDSYGRLGLAWGDDLGAARFDVAGHARQGDGAAENDFYDGNDLMGRLEWRLGEDSTLGVLARVSDNEIGIPVASGVATPNRTQESESLQLAVPFRIVLGDWSVEALASQAESEFRFEDPDAAFSLNATDAERQRLRSVVRWAPGDDLWLAGGLEWQEDEVSNESNFGSNLDGATRDGWAVFAQAQTSFGPVRVDVGVRQDDDEFFGSQVTPRGGVVVDLGGSWQLFGSYAEGFRAPSLGELFFPFFGNPDLEPEESETVEAGVRFDNGVWWGGVAYFDNDFTNLIDSDPITFTAINVGRATTDGWELELGFRQGMVEVSANTTLLETRDLDTGLELLRRPEERASLLLAVRPESLVFQLTGRWVGEREDLDPITFGRVRNDSYTVADLGVTWDAGKVLAPYARVGNVTDEEYEEVVGFPALGRTWAVGLEVRWP